MDFTQARQFNFPTIIRFGAGVIKELGPYLKKKNILRPLLVTDPVIAELGFFKNIVADLSQHGLSVEVFSDIHKNPVKSDVYKGTEHWDATQSDAVIGIGGGAALDVARAIVLRVNHREDLFKYDDLIGGDVYVTNDVPPFITIPTTAGAGSEVGRSAIIADDVTHQKKILFSPKLLAQIVFADPLLTMDLPANVTAATGMDALTHNMEAYIAKNFHPICEGIALEGMKLIAESIQEAVLRPSLTARSKMLLASMMGAIAFQKGLGVVHSLAHPLSSLVDMHHGLANAINLPYGMEYNFEGFEHKFDRMAQALNIPSSKGGDVITYIHELNHSIGIPSKLSNAGVNIDHVDTLASLAYADFAHPNNPKPVTEADFKALYLKAL